MERLLVLICNAMEWQSLFGDGIALRCSCEGIAYKANLRYAKDMRAYAMGKQRKVSVAMEVES